jgi:hypothetical protein
MWLLQSVKTKINQAGNYAIPGCNNYSRIQAHQPNFWQFSSKFCILHIRSMNPANKLFRGFSKPVRIILISTLLWNSMSAGIKQYAHQMINKAYIPVLSFPNYHIRVVGDDIWTLGAFNAR